MSKGRSPSGPNIEGSCNDFGRFRINLGPPNNIKEYWESNLQNRVLGDADFLVRTLSPRLTALFFERKIARMGAKYHLVAISSGSITRKSGNTASLMYLLHNNDPILAGRSSASPFDECRLRVGICCGTGTGVKL